MPELSKNYDQLGHNNSVVLELFISLFWNYFLLLKNYCRTLVLQAHFTAGGKFMCDIVIKYFYNLPSNQVIYDFFYLILNGIEVNTLFLTLFIFSCYKQNVNNNKGPRYHSGT